MDGIHPGDNVQGFLSHFKFWTQVTNFILNVSFAIWYSKWVLGDGIYFIFTYRNYSLQMNVKYNVREMM